MNCEVAQARLPWAVRHLAGPDGYLEAAGQEVCLQLYGGLALATRLNAASDSFRASAVPERAEAAPPAHRRPRRRRAPSLPFNAPAAPSVPVPDSDDEASPDAPTQTPVGSIPDASWAWLDTVDLTAEFRTPIPTIRTLPPFLHSPAIRAYLIPLRVIASATSAAQASRAWTLFLLTPRLLFSRSSTAGRRALLGRVDDYVAGRWEMLLTTAHQAAATPVPPHRLSTQPAAARRRARACAQVRTGDLSRARQTLTSLPLAPGTAATLAALRDPARRPPTLLRPIPEEVRRAAAPPPTRFSAQIVADALRSAKRGSAAGLSGSTTDHYKALLADEEALDLLAVAVTRLAAADLPAPALAALRLARLTALQKPDGGVRGIATGDAFRRLASRVLARHYADTFDRLTRPFQYALQARAGTDALAGLLRASLETGPGTVVVSIDGRAAYDTVSRATVLSQVSALVPSLLPFVQAFYGSTSTYLWRDELGEPHILEQGEGLEQGDSLAPALYALAQHRALAAAAQVLPPTATLAAFLDDLYILCPTPEARSAYNTVTRAVAAHAGVSANQGKTRIYGSLPQAAPANLADLGPAVWCSDREPAARGFVAVGTPLGSPEYIAAHLEARLQEHQHLLDELPQLPDLQSAWLLLTFCAAPRAQHSLRTIPPSATTRYATAHDTAIAGALAALLGESTGLPAAAQELAFLPTQLGGLGLCSATRTKEAAYWAAWADLLPVIHARAPALAQDCHTAWKRAGRSGSVPPTSRPSRPAPWPSRLGSPPPLDLSDRRRRLTTSFGRPRACLVAPWVATPRICRSHDLPPTGVRVAFLAPQPPSPPPLPSWARRRGMASSSAIGSWHHPAPPGHEHCPPAPATLTSPSHCRHLWRRRPWAWLWRAPRPVWRPRACLPPLGRLGPTRAARRACMGAGCARSRRRRRPCRPPAMDCVPQPARCLQHRPKTARPRHLRRHATWWGAMLRCHPRLRPHPWRRAHAPSSGQWRCCHRHGAPEKTAGVPGAAPTRRAALTGPRHRARRSLERGVPRTHAYPRWPSRAPRCPGGATRRPQRMAATLVGDPERGGPARHCAWVRLLAPPVAARRRCWPALGRCPRLGRTGCPQPAALSHARGVTAPSLTARFSTAKGRAEKKNVKFLSCSLHESTPNPWFGAWPRLQCQSPTLAAAKWEKTMAVQICGAQS